MQAYRKVVMYRMHDKTILTKEDIEKAFHVMTGMKHEYDWTIESYTNDKEYIIFLNKLFGKTITEYFVPNVDDLIIEGKRIYAIKAYRADKKCSLKEAKEYVDMRSIELAEKTHAP